MPLRPVQELLEQVCRVGRLGEHQPYREGHVHGLPRYGRVARRGWTRHGRVSGATVAGLIIPGHCDRFRQGNQGVTWPGPTPCVPPCRGWAASRDARGPAPDDRSLSVGCAGSARSAPFRTGTRCQHREGGGGHLQLHARASQLSPAPRHRNIRPERGTTPRRRRGRSLPTGHVLWVQYPGWGFVHTRLGWRLGVEAGTSADGKANPRPNPGRIGSCRRRPDRIGVGGLGYDYSKFRP